MSSYAEQAHSLIEPKSQQQRSVSAAALALLISRAVADQHVETALNSS